MCKTKAALDETNCTTVNWTWGCKGGTAGATPAPIMRLSIRWTDNRFVPLFGQYNYNNRAEWRVTPRYSLTLRISLKRIIYTTAPPAGLFGQCRAACARAARRALFNPRVAPKIRLKATLNKLRQWAKLRGSGAQMFSDYCARDRGWTADRRAAESCAVTSSTLSNQIISLKSNVKE